MIINHLLNRMILQVVVEDADNFSKCNNSGAHYYWEGAALNNLILESRISTHKKPSRPTFKNFWGWRICSRKTTLPETNAFSLLKMDGWNTISYWVSAYFQGKLTVGFREGKG